MEYTLSVVEKWGGVGRVVKIEIKIRIESEKIVQTKTIALHQNLFWITENNLGVQKVDIQIVHSPHMNAINVLVNYTFVNVIILFLCMCVGFSMDWTSGLYLVYGSPLEHATLDTLLIMNNTFAQIKYQQQINTPISMFYSIFLQRCAKIAHEIK